MAYVSPSAVDLSTYLGQDVDPARATLLLDLAEKRCLAVVNPLPDGAEAIVLDVVTRAYSNPTNLTSDATGPYLTTFGRGSGGLWLTAQNIAALRSLAGGGMAFTIDPTPADAGPLNMWAQVPMDPNDPGPYPPWNDFDQPA